MIGLKFASHSHAALSRAFAISRSSIGRGRVRSGLNSADRRDRRRQVDPRRSRRPAPRRPRVGRPGAHRRGTATVEAIFERRTAGRSSSGGRSRRRAAAARSSTARSSRAARCATWPAALVELHGQHEHQMLLDPATHLDVARRVRGPRRRNARSVADGVRRVAEARDRARPPRWRASGRARRAPSSSRSSWPRSIASARSPAKTTSSRRRGRCWPTPTAAAPLRRRYAALYEGDQAALAALGVVWRKVGELAALDARFAPYLDGPRRHQAAARGSRVLPPLVRRRHRGAARRGCRRSRSGWRCSSVSSGSTARRSPTSSAKRDALAAGAATCSRTGPSEPPSSTDRSRRRASAYLARAGDLSTRRRAAAPVFSRTLEKSLAELAMARTRFEVRFRRRSPTPTWTERGLEQAEFYVSPNPGEDLRPLARIASGGELSRIMLALKTLGSNDAPGKTLDLRRGRRRHRRARRRRRRRAAAERSASVSGALHHAPAADRRVRRHALLDREAVKQGRTVTRVDRLAGRRRVRTSSPA